MAQQKNDKNNEERVEKSQSSILKPAPKTGNDSDAANGNSNDKGNQSNSKEGK